MVAVRFWLAAALLVITAPVMAQGPASPAPTPSAAAQSPHTAPNPGFCADRLVMSQADLEARADLVKDSFPARYRALLQDVKLTLSGEIAFAPYVASGRDGTEIIVPYTILYTNCVLAFAALSYNQLDLSGNRQIPGPSQKDFENCLPSQSRQSCIVHLLGIELYRESVKTDQDPQMVMIRPIMSALLIQAFDVALAHEYGHVILDSQPGAKRRPAAFDAEFEADLQALNIVVSGQTSPLSDTLLFGGYALLDHLGSQAGSSDGTHEASVCRAMRSSLLRARLLPHLNRIHTWRSRRTSIADAMYPIMSAALGKGTLSVTRFAGQTADCNQQLPPLVGKLEADVKLLAETLATLPKAADARPEHIRVIADLKMQTPFGTTLRDRLSLEPPLGRALLSSELALSDGATSEQMAQLSADLAAITLVGDPPSLPAVTQREVRLVRAIGSFALAPRGSSFASQAARLHADLAPLRAIRGHDSWVVGALGYSDLMSGECAMGFDSFIELDGILGAFDAEIRRIVPTFEDKRQGRRFISQMAGIARNIRSAGTPITKVQCDAMQANVRANYMRHYGWTE